MTWGVVVKNGLAYVNDFNNGLFIVRLEPKRRRPQPAGPVTARDARVACCAGRPGGPRPGPGPPDTRLLRPSSRPRRSTGSQLMRFGPARARRSSAPSRIGFVPTDPAGPHGLGRGAGRQDYFVSTGARDAVRLAVEVHHARTTRSEGRVELGNFPATLQVSPDGYLAYVVNFNLHGDMVPSSVSVVATDEMVEIARIPTCTMPHGSRLNPQGTRHYSACMMDDMLVEIDTRTLAVSRAFLAAEGRGARHDRRAAVRGATAADAGRRRPRHGRARHGAAQAGRRVLLAHLGAALGRRPARLRGLQQGQRDRRDRRRGLDASRGGFLRATGSTISPSPTTASCSIATNKRGQSVSVFDAPSGKELKRLPTKRKVVHGVADHRDDRYAFVSVEGVGLAARDGRDDRSARARNRGDRGRGPDGRRDRRVEVRTETTERTERGDPRAAFRSPSSPSSLRPLRASDSPTAPPGSGG